MTTAGKRTLMKIVLPLALLSAAAVAGELLLVEITGERVNVREAPTVPTAT